jgi:hypothetical protein
LFIGGLANLVILFLDFGFDLGEQFAQHCSYVGGVLALLTAEFLRKTPLQQSLLFESD